MSRVRMLINAMLQSLPTGIVHSARDDFTDDRSLLLILWLNDS
jgi:hypothetical protein